MCKCCVECGRPYAEGHHRVFRSECKPLEHCKQNIVYLCNYHHKGTYGPHGSKGEVANRKYKLEFQEWLYTLFNEEEYYRPSEIKAKLGISVGCTEHLLKNVDHRCYLYRGEKIIRACMGGKIY